MSVVRRQYELLKSLNRSEFNKKAIEQEKDFIIILQKSQMRKGQTPRGGLFANYVSKEYADSKQSKLSYLAPYPKADLFLTGVFQGGIYLVVEGTNVRIDSIDDKAPKLKVKYQPFGLNKSNMNLAQIPVTAKYFKLIHKYIN